LERVERIDLVVFDKTGTLTMGEPALTDFVALQGTERDLLHLAASAEQGSAHPLAKMLVRTAKQRKIKLNEPEHFFAMAGAGVEATIQGAQVLVGSTHLFTDRRFEVRPHLESIHALQDQGKTVILVGKDDAITGILAFADPLKPEACDAVERLQGMGIEVALVTGDNVRTAKAVASQLGIKKSFAEITPQGKAGLVKALQEGDKIVAMVGDGVNDAPALAAADVGIAIGSGADVAVEAGDFVLLKNDPRDVPAAIELGRETLAIVRKNLKWALGYNAVLIPLAALGVLPPLAAGLAMAISSLPVAANSMRVAKKWEAQEAAPEAAPEAVQVKLVAAR
jgi:heavy metal translocating P-type ATPase